MKKQRSTQYRKIFFKIGGIVMNELFESDAFLYGVKFGIDLYQQRILETHRRRQPLMINGDLYYLQSGRERLEDMIDKICE